MKKLILVMMFIMLGFTSSMVESQVTSARIVLNANVMSAKQGDLINVQAFINSPDARIAGADIEVSVDPLCLRIERLDVGEFLPTTEGQGYIIKQEQNEISARLVVTVLNVNLSAQGEGVYMNLPLRVMCESGVAQVNITRSELVDDLTNQFTAQTQSIELLIESGASSTSQPTPIGNINPIGEQTDYSGWIIIAGLVSLGSLISLVILWVVNRNRRKQAEDKAKSALEQKAKRG